MSWRTNVVATLVAVGGMSMMASADVTDLTITGASNDASLFLPDGWQEGRDWGWAPNGPDADAWAVEHWIGMDPVDLNVGVVALGGPDVNIQKSLLNDTDFKWTSFIIELTPLAGQGPIVVDPGSVSSSIFNDSNVVNHGDGSATITFFDGSVGVGANVSMLFTFNITGNVALEMVQTPVPTPAGLAVLGLGGLVAARRRR